MKFKNFTHCLSRREGMDKAYFLKSILILLAAVFAFPAALDAVENRHRVLHNFSTSTTDGRTPYYNNILIDSGKLYGMTYMGGSSPSSYGTIFSMDTDGTDFTLLHSFTGTTSDGRNPFGSLTLDSGKLYGMTYQGGASNYGTIFSIDPDGTDFSLLHSFSSLTTNGRYPYGGLTSVSGKLYGMTSQGGATNQGTIFSIDPDGTDFTILKSTTSGSHGSLIENSGKLYGMTCVGTDGTIFSMDLDGTDYTTLHMFGGSGDGRNPNGSLILESGKLYGMTGASSPGSGGAGTIFSLDPDGTDYWKFSDFVSATTGGSPQGDLIMYNGKLYGLTSTGGPSGGGTLFSITPGVPSSLTVLQSFSGTSGQNPLGSLSLDPETGIFYGMTQYGGTGVGTIFEYDANTYTLDDAYKNDIVFSNYTNGSSNNINSYVYWEKADNTYSVRAELATQGARGNSTADLNNDGYLDLIFANNTNGTSTAINSYVYWGAETDPYTTKTQLATLGANGNSTADINGDGYLDIVFANTRNGSAYNVNSYVYWGAETNPYTTKKDLATLGGTTGTVADLNKDGYQDIVFSNYYNGSSYNINSYVYWGDASNSYTSKTNLATQGAFKSALSDLNNDGYVDIVFANYYNGTSYNINSYVYWGAETNPYTTKTDLATSGAENCAIADLNRDGYNDIVFANYYNGTTRLINSYIYWGAETNPYATKTDLATQGALAVAIDDLNGDGWLDIVFGNHHNNSTYLVNSYVYWGAETDPYTTRTDLATQGTYGVSLPDSPIFSGNISGGNALPLWVTEGQYDYAEITSPEYQLLATTHHLVNGGALDWSGEEVAQITAMYFSGKEGSSPSPVTVDTIEWKYFNEEIVGKSYGDAWYDDGEYWFQMGSGITSGDVPDHSLEDSATKDIIFSRHDGNHAAIYWDDPSSPYATKTSLAADYDSWGSPAADLNGDGYLDVVVSATAGGDSTSIFWGSENATYSSVTELDEPGDTRDYGTSMADLNADGYLDIIVSADSEEGRIYWGDTAGSYANYDLYEVTPGSVKSNAVADLNGDGYLDIVTAADTRSVITWGDATSSYNSTTNLDPAGCIDAAIADLNGDGYLEIVASGKSGTDSRIYWGDATASYSSGTNMGSNSKECYGASIADLNRDGYQDIILSSLNLTDGIKVWWGNATADYGTSPDIFPISTPHGNAIDDINKDGWLDIVVASDASGSNALIFWGAETNPFTTSTPLGDSGYSHGVSLPNSLIHSSNTSYGSVIPLWATEGGYSYNEITSPEYQFIATTHYLLNSGALDFSGEDVAKLTKLYFEGDGGGSPDPIKLAGYDWSYFGDNKGGGHSFGDAWYENGSYIFYMESGVQSGEMHYLDDSYKADIVFSGYYNGSSYITDSYVYWDDGSNQYDTKTQLPTIGSIGNAIADLNNDGHLDMVFANFYNGSNKEINSHIYWGNDTSPYSESEKTELPTKGAIGTSIADLNADGYLDIVFGNQSTNSSVLINSYIYWGGATAPYSTKTDLPSNYAHGTFVADLNEDGYQDIVISNGRNSTNTSYNGNSYVYWGAASNPYSTKTELPTILAFGSSVADLNGDGHLDIVFANSYNGSTYNLNSYVYWGAENNPYSTKLELATHGATDVSLADLNRDGYQDIIFSNYRNDSSYNVNSYIYWGDATASYTSLTELATHGSYSNAIADLNKDGWLDIIFGNMTNGATYGVDSYIYWGAETNPYTTMTELATLGAAGVSIANSLIFAGNTAYGNVVPLWMTGSGGDYNWGLITSPEFQFIGTTYYTLNSGALDFTAEQVAQLTKLYFDGKAGLNPDPIWIGGYAWHYFSENLVGRDYGDAWYENGIYTFYMGSGIRGSTSVPELPAGCLPLISILAGIMVLCGKIAVDRKL